MTIFPLLQEAWQTVRGNRWRSLLTAFGVFWGVFVMVLLSAVGTIASGMVHNLVSATNPRSVAFSTLPTSKPYGGHDAGRKWEVTLPQVEKIREAMGTKIQVGLSVYQRNKTFQVKQNDVSAQMMLQGVDNNYVDAYVMIVTTGRNFSRLDSEERRSVCLLGDNVAEQLFGDAEPLGQQIEVEGHFFTVVGTVKGMMPVPGQQDPSRVVFIPFELMQQLYMGDNDAINTMGFDFGEDADTEACIQEVWLHLASLNNLDPEDDMALLVVNFNTFDTAFSAMDTGTILLALLGGAGILFAALLGVSTIILATIKDRTRDIAMRRVIGASNWDIVSQIMTESLLLSLTSGLCGLLAACWTIQLGRHVLESMGYSSSMLYLPLPAVVMALVIIVVGGMLASALPIRKALSIELVDALSKD